MAHKLVICLLEEGPKCIMLLIHLKMIDTIEESSTEAIVDTSATRDFILSPRPTCYKLSQPIPVYNVDRTPNEAGSIHKVVDYNLQSAL